MCPAYEPAGYCQGCGYRIDPGLCPECGRLAKRVRKTHPRVRRRRILIFIAGIVGLGIACWFVGRPIAERFAPNWILRRLVGAHMPWPLFQPPRGPIGDWAGKVLQSRLAVAEAREQAPGKARLARIEAELGGTNNPDWAGAHVTEPNLGFFFRLTLSPNSGYAIMTAEAQPDRCRIVAHGEVTGWNHDYIELKSRIDVALHPAWLPSRFLVVRWGGEICLVPQAQAAEFSHDYNAGRWTPFSWYRRSDAMASWYTPGSIIPALPIGVPNGPPAIAELLVPTPIQGTVIAKLSSRVETVSKGGQSRIVGHHYLRLNVGTQQGVRSDMRFYRPDYKLVAPAVVESVDANSCVVRLSITPPPGKEPKIPALGSRLSTRQAAMPGVGTTSP